VSILNLVDFGALKIYIVMCVVTSCGEIDGHRDGEYHALVFREVVSYREDGDKIFL
jgi:hypothetical protein